MPREVYTVPWVFPQTSASNLRKHVPKGVVVVTDVKERYWFKVELLNGYSMFCYDLSILDTLGTSKQPIDLLPRMC